MIKLAFIHVNVLLTTEGNFKKKVMQSMHKKLYYFPVEFCYENGCERCLGLP